ncbi:MAG: TIGR02996 domain-containing protein [Kofleriaceae bacterium]
MEDTEQELLATICEEPEADGPRLVYADWLTQRGDVRGELIVAGVQLARLDDRDPRRYPLLRHEASLRQATAQTRELPGGRLDRLERGFPTRLVIEATAIAELPPHVGPPVHTLAIRNLGESTVADVMTRPVAGLTALELHGMRGLPDALNMICRWRALAPIEHLVVQGAFQDGTGLARLLDGPLSPFAKLRSVTLAFESRQRQPAGLRDLPRGGLERLALSNMQIRDAAIVEALGLRALSLERCQASISAFAPTIARLEELRVDNVPGAGDDLAAFVAGNPGLRRLQFSGPRYRETVTTAGLATILTGCRELKTLAVIGARLAEPGFTTAIAALPAVVELDLSHNDLVDASVLALAAAPAAQHLRVLRLSHNAIGDVGAHTLLTAPVFADLGILELDGNPISPKLVTQLTARFG